MPLLDGFAYSGAASLLKVDRFTTDVFGISLADDPPRATVLHLGQIGERDYAARWEARSCTAWQRLAVTYGFQLIVVSSSLHLQLPRADADPRWNKYSPRCA